MQSKQAQPPKRSEFTVHLRNLVPRELERVLRFSDEVRRLISEHISAMFTRVVAGQVVGQTQFVGARSTWNTHLRTIEAGEVLVYFVRDRGASVISAQGGHDVVANDSGGGTFFSQNGMISEVWINTGLIDANRPLLLANLAFHEAMHNKLDAHPQLAVVPNGIHPTGGMAAPVVSSDTQLNGQNIAMMQNGLGVAIPQFLGRL